MMLDITKQWTWAYVERELPKVPNHIPVLVMGNLRDMGEHRTVQEEDIRFYIDHFERPRASAPVKYAESSMKNGFGLKYLHTFFNIPFLQLQRETLLLQLERNQLETDATVEELQLRRESEDQNYDLYLESLDAKRQQKKAKKLASPPNSSLNLPNGQTSSTAGSSTSSTPARISPAHTPSETPSRTPPVVRKDSSPPGGGLPQANAASTPTEDMPREPESLTQKFSKWFSSNETKIEQGRKDDGKAAVIEPPAEILTKPSSSKISTVDDFIPDEGLDGSFFDDESEVKQAKKSKKKPKEPPKPIKESSYESESEDDTGNPMVAGYQEDLDSEDEKEGVMDTPSKIHEIAAKPAKVSSKDVDLSSDDDFRPTVTQDVEDYSADNGQVPSIPTSTTNQQSLKVNHSNENEVEIKDTLNSEGLSLDLVDGNMQNQYNRSSSSEQDTTTPSSSGIQLQVDDLDFLESVTSKASKTSASKKKLASRTNAEFDMLVDIAGDERVSESETSTTTSTTSSSKKKKHKSKDKEEDKINKKQKHKKHKEKESSGDKEEKKKKKKHKQKEAAPESEGDQDDLEKFLEGGEYEAF